MWISQVIFTPVTALSSKRVSWSIMHVCRECSWLYEFTIENKEPGFLRTCTHQQHLTTNTFSWNSRTPFSWQRLLSVPASFLFSFRWLAAPRVPSRSASQMGRNIGKVLWSMCFIPIEPQEKCLLPLSVMKHDTGSLCIQVQFCHALLHLEEEWHVPMDKPLKHFLICLGNKDRNSHLEGQGGTKPWKHEHKLTQAFKGNGNVSHLFSLLHYFKHSCKDDTVDVLLAVPYHYWVSVATTYVKWVVH